MVTFVAVNPMAGGGSAGRAWPNLSGLLQRRIGDHVPLLAAGPGDVSRQVANAASQGATRLIAVGGDGTINEAINGLAGRSGSIPSDITMGVIPVGTGGDFARSIDIPSDPLLAIDRIAAGRARTIDIGRVTFLHDDGLPRTRLFANIASFGISGLINRKVTAASLSRILPGAVSYYLATVRGLLSYRFQRVRVAIDDLPPIEPDIALIAIANCRYFGGGMMIAPDAEPDDGAFDIVVLRGTSKWVLLRDLRLVYGGRHRDHPSITITRGRRVHAEPDNAHSDEPILLEFDGEAAGRLPATFEILPRALNVLC